ncbi:hypothetical protein DFH08DRAFT_60845 [Mycena albidolilacea]|uniref:Uncharacterized protein n=1 Tax=Mycena albidolilacea TaxID=1033008 RepID=A0AAD7EXH2_9AGAR|nr:hypothetical protein DFH08DRAFT_60845 [Mycena albidolilacea]
MAPGSPTLPRELEREIFELCALSRREFIPKLMLVAQRVKEWVEPLRYRTIILGGPTTITQIIGLPLFNDDIIISLRRPPTFFHTAVRYLVLFASSDMKAMLALCTKVEDLWIYDLEAALIPLIGALPLKRLSVNAARTPLPPGRMFSHLTHLNLRGIYKDAEICAFIAALPKLTHLSVSSDASILVSHNILDSSPSMCVIVVFERYGRNWSVDKAAVGELPQDVRFVVMRSRDELGDWYAGIQRGTDYWSDAETFVEKRRRGELDSRNYFWEPAT